MLRYHSHLFPSRRHSLLSIIPYSSRRGGGRIRVPLRSLFTTKPPPPPPPSIPSKENPPRILTRLSRRLPKFLHPYTNRLVSAPLSHITSFLILHELSAVVPLVALFGLFHYTSWLPGEWLGETVWAKEKAEKLVRYLERKGYWKGRFQRKNKEKKDEEKEEEEGEEGGSEGNLSSNSGRIGERISRVLLEYVLQLQIVFIVLSLFSGVILPPPTPIHPSFSISPQPLHTNNKNYSLSLSPPEFCLTPLLAKYIWVNTYNIHHNIQHIRILNYLEKEKKRTHFWQNIFF